MTDIVFEGKLVKQMRVTSLSESLYLFRFMLENGQTEEVGYVRVEY